MQIQKKPERIIRLREVKERTGISTSTIYCWMKHGLFPSQISLGNKLVGWKESEIERWIEDRSAPMEIL